VSTSGNALPNDVSSPAEYIRANYESSDRIAILARNAKRVRKSKVRSRFVQAGPAESAVPRRGMYTQGHGQSAQRTNEEGSQEKEKEQTMSVHLRGNVFWMDFVFEGKRVQRSTKVGNKQLALEIERTVRTDLRRRAFKLDPEPPPPPPPQHLIQELSELLQQRWQVEGKCSRQNLCLLKMVRLDWGAVRDLLRAGVSQSTAMRISGHRTASVFRRYDIVEGDDVQRALDKQKLYRAG